MARRGNLSVLLFWGFRIGRICAMMDLLRTEYGLLNIQLKQPNDMDYDVQTQTKRRGLI